MSPIQNRLNIGQDILQWAHHHIRQLDLEMVDRLVDGWVDKREWVPGGIPQKLVTSPWENHKKTCIETPNFRCISSFSCGKPLVKKVYPSLFWNMCGWCGWCSEHGKTRHQPWNTTACRKGKKYHFELLIHPFILKFEYNSNSRWSPLTNLQPPDLKWFKLPWKPDQLWRSANPSPR